MSGTRQRCDLRLEPLRARTHSAAQVALCMIDDDQHQKSNLRGTITTANWHAL